MAAPGALAEDVLEVVDQVPPGRVLTYGDVARALGRGGARSVGQVMARHGGDVPWWRVVRADGSLPDDLVVRAREHWLEEDVPLVGGAVTGRRVDLRRARWDLAGLRVPMPPGCAVEGLSVGRGSISP